MSAPTICTIIAKNYLAAARCLTDSFLAHHPNGQVYVLVIDKIEGYFTPDFERFTTVLTDDLKIQDFKEWLLYYTMLEVSTAVKPFFLEYLFRERGHDKVCYFDPDIYFYQPVDEIWDLLDRYGIVLTPHLLDFLDDAHKPSELDILRAGCYNLGFIGLSKHPELGRFLEWWQKKLIKHCIVDFEKGYFVDQKWIDLAPSLFSSVYIHRDPGCDVAYWNLNHRDVQCQAGVYTVNDVPLKFFHFSGFYPDRMDILSKHQDRFTLPGLPAAVKSLFEAYRDCMLANDYLSAKQWPYTYGYHPKWGVNIPNVAYATWRELGSNRFSVDDKSSEHLVEAFLTWLNEPIDREKAGHPLITRLAWGIYQQRSDLQRVYPDLLGWHRKPYVRWFLRWAKADYNLDEFFLEPMRKPRPVRAVKSIFRIFSRRFYIILVNFLFSIGIGSWLEQRLGEKVVSPARNFFLNPAQTIRQVSPVNGVTPRLTRSKKVKATPGLNIIGYLRDETGVGEVARAALKALDEQRFPVAWTMVASNRYRQNDFSVLHLPEGNQYVVNCFYVNADQAGVVYNELGPEFFRGKYNIGYWHWELSQFPQEWYDRFQYFDEIWVASNFVQNAVASVSPVPVVTIGNPVTKRPPSRITRRQLGLPEDKFLFLFVFDMLSFVERKNPFGVIETYRRAFGSQPKETQLIMKVTNLDQFPPEKAALEAAIKSVSGLLIDGYQEREALNGLFHNIDAYVSLHRSEGFGMTMAEAMALGKPTIGTAYAANTDFMTVANSYPVGYQLTALEKSYGPYQKGQVWADPDLDHAAAQMKRVVAEPAEAQRIGAQAAADIQRLYGHEAIAKKIIRRLEVISA